MSDLLPVHFPMSVDSEGHGPLGDHDPDIARIDCWCEFRMPWPHPGCDSGDWSPDE